MAYEAYESFTNLKKNPAIGQKKRFSPYMYPPPPPNPHHFSNGPSLSACGWRTNLLIFIFITRIKNVSMSQLGSVLFNLKPFRRSFQMLHHKLQLPGGSVVNLWRVVIHTFFGFNATATKLWGNLQPSTYITGNIRWSWWFFFFCEMKNEMDPIFQENRGAQWKVVLLVLTYSCGIKFY